jgi:hypothetical protein
MRVLRPWRRQAMSWRRNSAPRLGVDGRVDRLVADVALGFVGKHALEGSGDLLGRPLPVEQREHDGPADVLQVELGRGARRLALGAGRHSSVAPFGKALVELGQTRPDIVGMTADLSKYTDLHLFAQAYPERFFQMGMAEQLLMAAAGGMAKEGFVPFATTYAVFGTRRAYDFVHQVIAEENLNVKMCCALPADHRLRPQPPGHRGPGADARHPGPDHRRPLRRAGRRAGGAADRRP